MKPFKISLKSLIPLPILILTAYGGGLFFGKHPEVLRQIWGGSKIILGTSGPLPNTSLDWLQQQTTHEIELRIFTNAPSSLELGGLDLLWIPSSEISSLKEKFFDPPQKLKEQVDLNLVRSSDRSLPILWKISPSPSGQPHLSRWMIADISGKSANQGVLSLFLETKFQELLISELRGFSSSLKQSLGESELKTLKEIPLHNLDY